MRTGDCGIAASGGEEKLVVAKKLLDEGDLSDAVSRAYYGMFHTA
ncbi:MAG: hypothetical protein ABEJ03_01775 [Candidatus Nanohaloarchaea archaeon]